MASTRKGISGVELSHTCAAMSAVFDDPNLVSSAGLVPVVALAEAAGLRVLADEHLTMPGDKGANAVSKVRSLVAGSIRAIEGTVDWECQPRRRVPKAPLSPLPQVLLTGRIIAGQNRSTASQSAQSPQEAPEPRS